MKYAQAQELDLHDEFEEFEESHTEVGEAPHSESEEMTGLDLGIAGGVVLIILIAMVMVWRINRQFGGKLKVALGFFVIGILINLITALWTFFAPHHLSIGGYSFDNHNLFMAVATIFFLASIQKFSRLIPRGV